MTEPSTETTPTETSQPTKGNGAASFEAAESQAVAAAVEAAQKQIDGRGGEPEPSDDAKAEPKDDKSADDGKTEKERYAERVAKERDEDGEDRDATQDDASEGEPKKLTRKERRAQWRREQEKRLRDGHIKAQEENQRILQEIRAERLAIEKARDEQSWRQRFEDDVRRDPVSALRRHFNMDADAFAASQLNDQQVSPYMQTELERTRTELQELKQMLTQRDDRERKAAAERDHYARVEHDIRNLVGVSQTRHAEEYPYFCALPMQLQEQMARQYHAKALRENPHILMSQLLDELDEAAEPIVEHIRGGGRKPAKSRDGHKREQTTPEPDEGAKSSGRSAARAAAEPANRGELTEADLRKAALRVAKEAIGKRRK